MVKVDEPDDDTACLMLRGLKSRYAEHHNVHITDDAVRAAVTLSRRYLTAASCRTRPLICSTPPAPACA
jgi:type VI secretion system protein VasG